MRVISGILGGRPLRSLKRSNFRPTSDRVKESLFNILANRIELEDAYVCDLFAGSGNLGIEALSRGAAHVVFIERELSSLRILRENISSLSLEELSTIVHSSVESFVRAANEHFDVIFADPPYNYTAYDTLLDTIAKRALLRIGGIIVIEHSGLIELSVQSPWERIQERSFGTTSITILKFSQQCQEENK